MALSTTITQCAPETTKFGRITQNKSHFAVQGHQFWYQSKAHIRLLIKTIARQVLRIKSWMYECAKNLYRGRRAVPLQTFTTRHSNRKSSIVMALSTTFPQCAPETTKFVKITRLNPPTGGGFPGKISVKFSVNVNGWPRYQTAKTVLQSHIQGGPKKWYLY